MTDLSTRKRDVLYAVVKDFIATAEPVGSAQVSEKKGISFSPATVRHVMAELEALGFLRRTHSSSGRVPTDLAFRLYVDRLMHLRPLSSAQREQLRDQVRKGQAGLPEVLKEACRAISDSANQAGLAVTPRADQRRLRHIEFLRLRGRLVLTIMVSESGLVENKILSMDRDMSQSDLNRMHNYLNERLSGKTFAEVRQLILLEMKEAKETYDLLLTEALRLGEMALIGGTEDVHIEGQSRLMAEPEFADVERMRQVLKTLEEKAVILQALEESFAGPGVRIFIGEEMHFPEVNGLTMITSSYSDNEGNRGLLGVIGPTRMDYARIIPLVEYTSRLVTEELKG